MSIKILDDDGASRLSYNAKRYVNRRFAQLTQAEYDALPIIQKMNGTTYLIDDRVPSSWSTLSDAEIAQAIAEADAGLADLYSDYGWRVGDVREVQISAMNSSGTFDNISWNVRESHVAQTIELVLMDGGTTSETGNEFVGTAASDVFTFVNSVTNKDGTTRSNPAFIVGIKNSLIENGYMNSTGTNEGSWDECARRNWCNGAFRQAIPSTLRPIFKKFNTITAQAYNSNTNQISQDYFALHAECEVFSNRAISTTAEASALKQLEWYKTPANRIKNNGPSGSAKNWWHRSPGFRGDTIFSNCKPSGGQEGTIAYMSYGISPFGCI